MFDSKQYYQKNKDKIIKQAKQWNKDNSEKVKKTSIKYYQKHKDNPQYKEYCIERDKKYRENNPEKEKERYKKYYNENKEKILATHKKQKNNPEYYEQWRKKNPEYNKNWSKTEKGKACKQRSKTKRRVNEKNIINTLTAEEWVDILKEYHFKCAYCNKEFTLFDRETRDHIIPISKGGNNVKENVVPACRVCNSKKNNKILKMR